MRKQQLVDFCQKLGIFTKNTKAKWLRVAAATPSNTTSVEQHSLHSAHLNTSKWPKTQTRSKSVIFTLLVCVEWAPHLKCLTKCFVMVLSTEWSQVEVIDLVNDGSGLGFGIVGGRSTGVVIKSILPGGIADKDRRLQSGDHILQIGNVHLRGLTADQVATVLRQAEPQVRMVVARPVESSSVDFRNLASSAPVVPTKILTDPEELNKLNNLQEITDQSQVEINTVTLTNALNNNQSDLSSNNSEEDSVDELSSPETERFTVELTKSEFGFGITIAGYVCEREDLSGIFIKSLNEGSDAFECGKICTNDRIVEVDQQSLEGCTNHEAVERIKRAGSKVTLTLERYLRGPKFEHLQEVLAVQKDRSPSPSVTTLSWIPLDSKNETQVESEISINSDICDQDQKEVFIEENFEANLEEDLESATKRKWEQIVGQQTEIIVANLTKLKGLGISLEGTVDVEGGVELRPHHYIRSILPEGPVGQDGKLNSGDELLEVNGQKLLGIKHIDVVKILRELPGTVRLVCARKSEENRVINTSQDREGFEARNILGGSLKNLLSQPEQRFIKAFSDTSLNTSSTVTVTDEPSLQKTKSRSLEATLAMWSENVEYVDLVKSDRGLGFSILDYQDPLDPKSTVIVVRSLVPNGVAEHDGRITPGDRLVSVNDLIIKNVALDKAVSALKRTLPGMVKLGISKPVPSSRQSRA